MNKSRALNLTLICGALMLNGNLAAASSKSSKKAKGSSKKKAKLEVLKPEEDDVEAIEKKEKESDSSEANRKLNAFELMIDLIGFTPSPTFGASVAYHLSPNQVLNFRYSSAVGLLSNMDEKLMFLGLKSFWGNSFYTNLGVSKRDFSFTRVIYPEVIEIDTQPVSTLTHTSSMGGELAIGNQWQFKNFTLGADWIGIFVPLTTSGAEGVDTRDEDLNSTSLQSANDDISYAKSSQILFARFYLGFAF